MSIIGSVPDSTWQRGHCSTKHKATDLHTPEQLLPVRKHQYQQLCVTEIPVNQSSCMRATSHTREIQRQKLLQTSQEQTTNHSRYTQPKSWPSGKNKGEKPQLYSKSKSHEFFQDSKHDNTLIQEVCTLT